MKYREAEEEKAYKYQDGIHEKKWVLMMGFSGPEAAKGDSKRPRERRSLG